MLKGQVALVTGASRGIGRAIALELAALGARVAINYAGSREKALGVVEEIKALGGEALAIQADVSSAQQVQDMFVKINENLGVVNILVNNAGITKDALIMRMKLEDWDQVLETNLKGVFLCTKNAVRGMMKLRQGKIINISSVVGIGGNIGQSNYAAAKAGVIGLTKTTALELATRDIQVNAIAPGFIKTEMTDKIPEEMRVAIVDRIPLRRMGEPRDVAKIVAFLAGPYSDYITGQVICVDGGLLI